MSGHSGSLYGRFFRCVSERRTKKSCLVNSLMTILSSCCSRDIASAAQNFALMTACEYRGHTLTILCTRLVVISDTYRSWFLQAGKGDIFVSCITQCAFRVLLDTMSWKHAGRPTLRHAPCLHSVLRLCHACSRKLIDPRSTSHSAKNMNHLMRHWTSFTRTERRSRNERAFGADSSCTPLTTHYG